MSQRLSQRSQGTPMKSQRPSQGTPNKLQTPGIGANELQDLARATVRYLLMNDYDKVPIKHSDIVKNVTKNVSKNTAQVIQVAAKMLRETFGIKLLDDGNRPNKHYILVNGLKHQEHISLSEECKSDRALLAIILSLIFMQTNGRWKDAGLEQAKVFKFLHSLKIMTSADITKTDHHEYFGDVKKTLESFKSQRFLDLVKIENTDPVKYEYRWGFRACEELSPRAALAFASEMYGRESIETWTAHYKAVCEHERG